MTALEFPGPGLTVDQWSQISVLTTSVRPGQALWISGYFVGLDHDAIPLTPHLAKAQMMFLPPTRLPSPFFSAAKPATVRLSQSGLRMPRVGRGSSPTLVDMAHYKPRKLMFIEVR